MDWNDCKYKFIAEKISDTELNTIINIMVDNYDNNYKYYDYHHALLFFETNVHSPEILTLIENTAREEIENEGDLVNDSPFFLWPFSYTDSEYKEEITNNRKEKICGIILDQIERVAREKLADRVFLRLHIGDVVNFESCVSHYFVHDKVYFYKDGGWGIANEDGVVIVKNHLAQEPSNMNCLNNATKSPYRVIQDRDTGLFGVLSLESHKEVIHCLYDEIDSITYCNGNKFVVKVKQNEKWGCYDENCFFIIDCKYDDIKIIDEWIECSRDGNWIIDLYNTEGKLLIGGYDHLEIEYIKNKQYFKFYFGTYYESSCVKEADLYGNVIESEKFNLNYNDSVCLVLDNHFRTIVKYNGQHLQIPLGIVFQSKQDLESYFPVKILLSGFVDLTDYNEYIYLKKRNEDKYIISDYTEYSYIKVSNNGICKQEHWVDRFIEDDEVIIVRIAKDGTLSWRLKVNEIGPEYYGWRMYRFCDKVGFFSGDKVSSAIYDAVAIDHQKGKTYVALIIYQIVEYIDDTTTKEATSALAEDVKASQQQGWNVTKRLNPNYISHKQYTIQYYEILERKEIKRMEDDWTIFDPTKYKWFPDSFGENNLDYDFGNTDNYSDDNSYEWTDEDAWDAMTDGMYGDYPGSGWDPEMFGY